MQTFQISCEAFARLAVIVEGYKPGTDRTECASVCIMNKGGRVIGIATNSRLAAFEFVGVTDQPDGQVLIVNDPALVKQCETEAAFASNLDVTVDDAGNATAMTTFGHTEHNAALVGMLPGNQHLFLYDKLLGQPVIKKSKGSMHWYLDSIAKLARASPSGRVVFPTHIAHDEPVILNDPLNPNWFGAFIPQQNDADERATPHSAAVKPDWFV